MPPSALPGRADRHQAVARVDRLATVPLDGSMDIELAARRLDALGNTTRLLILHALLRAGDDGVPVRRLQAQVGVVPASTMSHHLRCLVAAGLVAQERRATNLLCRADPAAIRGLAAFLLSGHDAAGGTRTRSAPDEGELALPPG
jgi:ArsR family transcriptional regulator